MTIYRRIFLPRCFITRAVGKRPTLLVVALTLLSIAPSLYAMPVAEIVAKANRAAYYQGADGKAKVEMKIIDSQGRERSRRFTILRKDIDDTSDGRQKLYVYFHSPADINKTTFMVWKNPQKDDDRWMYLPALDLVKRIAASDERTSFMGSHFFYEDVSGRTPTEDEHQLLQETEHYYILKSTPKKTDVVEFAYYKNWIHKQTFIPVKTAFYDEMNKAYRRYEALVVEKIEAFNTVTQAKITDTRIGGYTTMSYSKVDYNVDIPEEIFSERYLRNSPRKYLR